MPIRPEKLDPFKENEEQNNLNVTEIVRDTERLPMKLISEFGVGVTGEVLRGKGDISLLRTEDGATYVPETGSIILPAEATINQAYWATYGFPGARLETLNNLGGLLAINLSPMSEGASTKHEAAISSTQAAYQGIAEKENGTPHPDSWEAEEFPRNTKPEAAKPESDQAKLPIRARDAETPIGIAAMTELSTLEADRYIPGGRASGEITFEAHVLDKIPDTPITDARVFCGFDKWHSPAETLFLEGAADAINALHTRSGERNRWKIKTDNQKEMLRGLIGQPGGNRTSYLPRILSPDLVVLEDQFNRKEPTVVILKTGSGWKAERFENQDPRIDRWILKNRGN